MKVLFIWDVPERLRAYLTDALADRSDVELVFPPNSSDDTLTTLAGDVHVMVGWRPSRALLDAATDLRLFINPGVGVQHLLAPFRDIARTRCVRLANGHGNTYFTAQHSVALLLALMNQVVPHHNWMRDGQWRKGDADAKSMPLCRRHVGLLGYGAVNRKVHAMLSGFDIDFSVLTRTGARGEAGTAEGCETGAAHQKGRGVTPMGTYAVGQLDAFLSTVDVLIVAVPLTPETEGLIGRHELSLLGSNGLLVNVGRGTVIDEGALYEALATRVIAGAALDVWYEYRPAPSGDGRAYPYAPDHRFHELDNVVLSPHRAASPFDDLGRWSEVVDNLRRVADGRDDLRNLVDLERGY